MNKVLFFAGMAEKVGQDQLDIQAEGITVEQLLILLAERYPTIKQDLSRVMVAINEEFVQKSEFIQTEDTIALIPPVSGG